MTRTTSTTGISAKAQQDQASEGIDKFELPRALVTRIAKSAIPESTKLQRETILALMKSSTVFINYLAATAHDVALSKQHKSISASDVLKALEITEFGDLVGPLQDELQIYRERVKAERSRKGSSAHASSSKSKGKSKAADKKEAGGRALDTGSVSAPAASRAFVGDSVSAGAPARKADPRAHDQQEAEVDDPAEERAEDDEIMDDYPEEDEQDGEVDDDAADEPLDEDDEELDEDDGAPVDMMAFEVEPIQADRWGLDEQYMEE